ncbi:hypothetical protein HPB51_026526 [Rhipicephalus microplus]|uniref:Uncharacterized protein n=1 Tax=Rhipicephalus microplus TaxID=6941 RepID=A0A9J6D2P3_RHIMP|nr:hypothetical protein HPB51_026526 [Rhipicephalus microplus]
MRTNGCRYKELRLVGAPVFHDKPSNNAYYNSDNGSKNYEDDNNDYNDGDDDYDNRDPRPSTFMADIVIAITSTGWLAFEGFCKATPPNTINIDNRGHTVLLCQYSDFSGGAENYIGDPVYTYGGFSNSSKSLTLSEYKDSLAAKGTHCFSFTY